jgi:ParB family chromosome partitioning protein
LAFSDEAARLAWAKQVVADGLSVRQLEREAAAARTRAARPAPPAGKAERDPNTVAAETRLTNRLGVEVEIKEQKRGGKIIVTCPSKDELMRVFDLLLGDE